MDFRRIKFKDLKNADLYLDAVYEGGNTKNAASEPLVDLLSVSVSGGFRYAKNKRLCCLFTTQDIPEWPDEFDIENGLFYYWGDNRKPGQERDRPVGNKSLKEWFNLASKGKEERKKISPIFVFSREKGWNRRFQGLLVPGCNKMSEDQNLISVWKQKNGLRFENYKAIFSILDVKKILREWIQDILDGNPFSQNAPKVWMDWINNGTIKNLKVSGDIAKIKKEDQLPISKEDKKIHELIIKFFRGKDDYSEFEHFAAKIFELSEITAKHGDVTRYTKDFGKDAYGTLTIGKGWGKCDFDYHLEAKYKSIKSGVGVKETSRLISRIKRRMFGVLVTTSYVNEQALEEIKEDGHPIIFITGRRLVEIVKEKISPETNKIQEYLEKETYKEEKS